MAVGVLQEFDATPEDYDKVNDALDAENNPPAGLIIHVGGQLESGKMRVMDVWESKEAWEEFLGSRLGPAVQEVMGEDAPPPTLLEVFELRDVVKP